VRLRVCTLLCAMRVIDACAHARPLCARVGIGGRCDAGSEEVVRVAFVLATRAIETPPVSVRSAVLGGPGWMPSPPQCGVPHGDVPWRVVAEHHRPTCVYETEEACLGVQIHWQCVASLGVVWCLHRVATMRVARFRMSAWYDMTVI